MWGTAICQLWLVKFLTPGLVVLAAGFALLTVAVLCREAEPLVRARQFLKLPRLQQALVVFAVCILTVCAQKQGTRNKEQGTSAVAEASGSDVSRRAAESAEEEANVVSAENGDLRTETRSSSQTSATSRISKLRAKTPLTSSSSNPCESVQSVDKNLPRVTTNDVARGYALVEVRTNGMVSYEMPTNGVEVGTWGKTGAYEDMVRVRLSTDCTDYHGLRSVGSATDCTDWHGFVWGDEVVTSLWAHTWGKVRPRIRDRVHEIVAVGTPMSCVPGEGRLWTAATTNGGWAITWENFVEGRREREIIELSNNRIIESEEASASGSDDSRRVTENAEVGTVVPQAEEESLSNHNSIIRTFDYSIIDSISAQIEFCPNGDFITWSNNVECVYRRVNPDDWDDDGIANEEDDEPMIAADETQFGPQQTLPDGANSNAYYWVDLVVSRANAKVSFVGDGASNLADPSFIAKAGETNRVTLLIGKTYHATCAFPFEIVGQSSVSIESHFDDDNRAADICWPVKISVGGQNASNASNAVALASEAASTSTASFTMSVEPACLDGVFAWTNVCCSISGSGSSFSYSCRSSCPCTGCFSSGYYVYEGYRIGCVGGTCGCLPSGGPPQDPASVSVSFSKNAIIFEDAYEASEGVMIARRSTETVLSCSASGGGRGGFLYVSLEGADKLALYGGQSLPYSKALAANETISFTCRYRAVKASAAEGDIKVTAMFAENETGTKQSAEATATAVRVRITPEIEAPENDCVGRHMYGIREEVRCRYFPSSAPVSWRVKSGCRMDGEVLTCSLDAMENPLSILCGNAVYTPNVSIVEPSGVECRDVVAETYGVPVNHAGGVGMRFELYVLPLTVSFERIAVEEVPCSEGTHTGYFAYSRFSGVWSHTEANGAGNWIDIQTGNLFGIDRPAITEELSRITDDGLLVDDDSYGWEDGELVWPIPLGWNDKGTTRGMKEYKRFATDVTHVTEIFENGRSGVRKLGNQVYRDIDGTVNLNGRIVHED